MEAAAFFTFASGPPHGYLCCGRSPTHHHTGQTEVRVELMPVLGQLAIPHFPVAEYILHNVARLCHKRCAPQLWLSLPL
jgi:hypothetical protein